jgi:hypothetical protein
MDYLIAYLLVGVITSIGMCLWFAEGPKNYTVIGFFLINLFFYPLTLAVWIQNAVIGFRYTIKCAWCGKKVNFKDPIQTQEHVKKCTKHPTLTRIAELEREIMALKTRQIYDVSVSMVGKESDK